MIVWFYHVSVILPALPSTWLQERAKVKAAHDARCSLIAEEIHEVLLKAGRGHQLRRVETCEPASLSIQAVTVETFGNTKVLKCTGCTLMRHACGVRCSKGWRQLDLYATRRSSAGSHAKLHQTTGRRCQGRPNVIWCRILPTSLWTGNARALDLGNLKMFAVGCFQICVNGFPVSFQVLWREMSSKMIARASESVQK